MRLKTLIFTTAILVTAAAYFNASADTLTTPLIEAGYGQLKSVHLTKNGKYLITLSNPGKVYIWDVATEKVIASVAPADTDWFVAVDLLPGDTTLITGTFYRTIAQWRIPDGKFRSSFSLDSYSRRVLDNMVASPDGSRIAVVQGYALRMISLTGQSIAFDSIPLSASVTDLLFSTSGKRIAYCDYSYKAHIFDAISGKHFGTFYHRNLSNNKLLPMVLFDYSPDDSTLLAYYETEDSHYNTYSHYGLLGATWGDSVLDFKMTASFNTPTSSRFIPGKPLAICRFYDQKRLFIYNVSTGDTVRSFERPTVQKISAVSVDGAHVLTSDYNNDIFLLSTDDGAQVSRFRGHCGWISSLDVTADGASAVTTSGGGNAKIWDLTTGLLTGTLDLDTGLAIQVVFTPDGSGIVTVSDSGKIALWDFGSRKIVRKFSLPGAHAYAVTVSTDGEEIAAGYDSALVIWDLKTGTVKNTFKLSKAATALKYSKDNRMIGAGCRDTVRVWDLASKKQVSVKSTKGYYVYTLDFSPDGTMLAVSTAGEVTTIYSVSSGDSIAGYFGTSSAWSPNGSQILVSGFSGAALFNMHTKQVDRYYNAHRCNIAATNSGAAFARSGTRIITTIGDFLQVWENSDFTDISHESPSRQILCTPQLRAGKGTARLQLRGYYPSFPLTVELLTIAGCKIAKVDVPCYNQKPDIKIPTGAHCPAGMYLYRIYERNKMLNSGKVMIQR